MLATGAACAPAPVAASDPPHISDVTMKPRRFAVDRHAPPEVKAGMAQGTTFRYTLSKDADVFFFLDRGVNGRVVGGRCHRENRRNRHDKPCRFYVRSGSFKQAGVQGSNVKRFSGRIGTFTLPPAHYKVKLVAVDTMGDPSPGKTLRFTVLRG